MAQDNQDHDRQNEEPPAVGLADRTNSRRARPGTDGSDGRTDPGARRRRIALRTADDLDDMDEDRDDDDRDDGSPNRRNNIG